MIINKVWPSKNELVFSISCRFSNGFCRHYQITFNMYLNAFILEPSHYTYKGNERGYQNDMPEHIKLLGLDKEPNEIKVGPRSKAFGIILTYEEYMNLRTLLKLKGEIL